MKRIQLTAIVLVLMLLCAGCSIGKAWKELRMDQVPQWMREHEGCLLVDVRTEEEFRKGHIPGALLVPVDEIRAGHLEALPDKEQALLLYCRTGRRAEDAAALLVKLGYRNVYAVGGIFDWTGEIIAEDR